MKLNKFWKALAVVAPVTGAISVSVSCGPGSGGGDKKDIGLPADYIYNRTFCLGGFNDQGQGNAQGTGWILSDATPNNLTDYQYYMATNWHVKYAITDTHHSTQLGYWHNDLGSDTDYYGFKSFQWVTDSQMSYDYSTSPKKVIDMHIVKVDFGEASKIPTKVRTKLNTLNAYQKQYGYINKFAQTTDTSTFVENEMYCGGYPLKQTHQTWKFETIKASQTQYHKFEEYPHPIDTSLFETATLIDQSPQYEHKDGFVCAEGTTEPIEWSLTAGSSGSMIITKQNNEWVIVGIFWGGVIYEIQSKNYFYPCWSIFKSDKKNFVSGYEK